MPTTSRRYDAVFFDTVGMAYTGATPHHAGLGGSEFQAILLAEALAARGRRVLVLNNCTAAERYEHVDYAPHAQADLDAIECDVLLIQRYSRLPPIRARKIVIAASDIPGSHYDHFDSLFAGPRDVSLVAVSDWQRRLFPRNWRTLVVPNMLPDYVYDVACDADPSRFVYASAALKGLDATLSAWRELHMDKAMAHTRLSVCTPGYDPVDAESLAKQGVRFLGSLPFRQVVDEIAASAGLFFVNTWTETFSIVAALAEALHRRTHILCASDPGALPTTINSPLLTGDRDTFLRQFREAAKDPKNPRWYAEPKDYRVSSVLAQWLELLDETQPPPRPQPQTARVCLSMIVKNEAHVIERCLRSVKPHVHGWAICDTGSSDGTQDIIRRYMADLPGELVERPWVDFATNRNEALELAKAYGDYALVIDADDTLAAEADFVWPALGAVGYLLEVEDAWSTRYWRIAVPRLDAGWHWQGVLHEALCSPGAVSTPRLPGLRIQRIYNDGARSQMSQREKFSRDAEVLRAALDKEPGHARYQFYLAQSLRDAGDAAGALTEYRKRVDMGGWQEEVYFSKLQIAALLERTQAGYAEVVAAYLDACDCRPTRAEAPCELARYFRLNERYTLARHFARIAANLPIPEDVLFIDRSVHEWRARDELAVASYWCGDRAESAQLCRDLLDEDSPLPAGERERVQRNLEFAEAAT